MEQKNAYFRVLCQERGVMLELISAKGGEPLKMDEIVRYLEEQKIYDYDKKAVNDAIGALGEEEKKTVFLTKQEIYPPDETLQIEVSLDKMQAVARFYPASDKGRKLSEEAIRDSLTHEKVRYGISKEALEQYIKNPVYCTTIVLAEGKEVVQGKNAEIIYHFNTDRKAKPQLNEDGTVDFHKLNNISHVKAGDLLAELIPEDVGIPGKNVYGEELKPARVERHTLKYGRNITISEDKRKITSDVDGQVTLESGKVFVSNTYEVLADVDTSTGDIDFQGNVRVHGNVRSGFIIKATGNVEVEGVVEGAHIEAGGQIILKRGIQGIRKGYLKAKENITAKFVESATVITEGCVETDSIINSDVSAKIGIHVHGKKGQIIGGEAKAGKEIVATYIGSASETNTILSVGMDPAVQKEVTDLKKNLEKSQKDKTKLGQLADMLRKKRDMGQLEEEKLSMLQKTTQQLILLRTQISKDQERLSVLEQEMQQNLHAVIKVESDIYPGVKMTISGESMTVQKPYSRCRFEKRQGEISFGPL